MAISYKIMKLAEASFHKFHMKCSRVKDPLYLKYMYLYLIIICFIIPGKKLQRSISWRIM